ncbi:MAG: glycosyltransferase family 4 protein [Candidatus Binatia bacterium]
MRGRRLVYLANARLPTEKAHGYQIVKMCEAFAQNGAKVLLLYPSRYQYDRSLTGKSMFDYYGVPPVFEAHKLLNLDIVPLNLFIPDSFFSAVFLGHALLWGFYAAIAARKEAADLYYTRDAPIAYWLVRLGLPTVYEAHVVPKRGQRWLLQLIARYPSLRLTVVLTSFIKQKFVEMGVPAEKVMVLPDGVDLSLFEHLPVKDECRQRLGLPQDRAIIGYIGRFRTMEIEKGIPELVEAMAHLPSLNGKETLLLCVGGPMDTVPAYLDIARHLGVLERRLKFVDRVHNREVPYWIRACDVVTIPWPWNEFSAYFTSPLKLFEYMAAGVPIVASDLPSLREVLADEENVLLVKPGDSRQLCCTISRLLKDPALRERLAQRSAQDVQRYTWKERASKILDRVNCL